MAPTTARPLAVMMRSFVNSIFMWATPNMRCFHYYIRKMFHPLGEMKIWSKIIECYRKYAKKTVMLINDDLTKRRYHDDIAVLPRDL